MRSRQRQGLKLALLALIGPVLVGLGLLFAVLGLMRRDMSFVAAATAERARSIFEDAHHQLEHLAAATGGTCSEQAIFEMQRTVFHHPYIREAGIFRDKQLYCTNLGNVVPPLVVEEAGRLVLPPAGQIHIVPPVHTLQGGESIIVDYRAGEDAGVNVLINPELIAEVLEYFAAGDDGVVLLKLRDGRALTPLANEPAQTVAIPERPEPGFRRVAGGFIAVASAEPYPIDAVVTAGYGWFAARWWNLARWPMLAALLATLVALPLARRRDDAREALAEAIEGGQLRLYYQPLYDMNQGRWVGAEALVRWQHPERGLVLPGDFIALAEDSGLIEPLTDWVLRRARQDLPRLLEIDPNLRVGINLSKQNLESEHLVESLDRVFPNGELLPRVVFEITERSLISEGLDRAKALIERLAAHGARFALDDFGTGYSGLSYLRHFNLSYVKIDGSFVRAIDTEAVTANIVDGVIALARSLKLELVAEGVETARQAELLQGKGIRLAQGFLYAPAVPLSQFLEQLAEQQNRPGLSGAIGTATT